MQGSNLGGDFLGVAAQVSETRICYGAQREEGVDAYVVEGVPEREVLVLAPPVGGVHQWSRILPADLSDDSAPVLFVFDCRFRQFHANT